MSTEVAIRTRSRPCSAATRGAQAVGAVGGQVELDAPGEVHERLDAGEIGHAVDDDAGAPLDELADRRDELLVGAVGGRELEDDAVGADRHRADPQQQVAADREPRGVPAGERLQANLGERVDDDLRAVDEQLVAEQVQVAVEHGLACDEHLASGGLGGGGEGALHVRSSHRSAFRLLEPRTAPKSCPDDAPWPRNGSGRVAGRPAM